MLDRSFFFLADDHTAAEEGDVRRMECRRVIAWLLVAFVGGCGVVANDEWLWLLRQRAEGAAVAPKAA